MTKGRFLRALFSGDEVRVSIGASMRQFSSTYFLFWLGVAAIVPGVTAANSSDCEMNTLQVVFPERRADDFEFPRTTMALPSPDAWLLEAPNGEYLVGNWTREPVETVRARLLMIDARLGHDVMLLEDLPGIEMQMIELRRVAPGVQTERAVRRNQTVLAEGVPVGGGFLRRIGANTDAVGGTWLFPGEYPSPYGNRMRLGCAQTCELEYGLDPDHGLLLGYNFVVLDETQAPDWIAIDRAVRTLVVSWIEDR